MSASPRVVILGDIARPNFYHLGDEAMTEAAIGALQSRGITDLVLIAADPSVATERYGLPAVPSLGLAGRGGPLADHVARLERFRSALTRPAETGSAIEAIRGADAVIVAGGGNVTSRYRGQLFERVAFVEAARATGIPAYITSQTIGPELSRDDAELIVQMVEYATVLGAREPGTVQLLAGLGLTDNVVLTPDDAALLTDVDYLPPIDTPFLIASFKSATVRDHIEESARHLDGLADALDRDVLLVSHVGSFDPDRPNGDQVTDEALVSASTTGRLHRPGQLTARELAGLSASAELSLGSRYHPVVYSTAAGSPSYPIAETTYSTVRMGGALSHLGMQDLLASDNLWRSGGANHLIVDTLPIAQAHLTAHAPLLRDYLATWWDHLADALKTGDWTSPGDVRQATLLDVGTGWSAARRLGEELVELLDVEKSLRSQLRVAQKADTRDAALADLTRQIERLQRRRMIRAADAVGRAWRRVRRR